MTNNPVRVVVVAPSLIELLDHVEPPPDLLQLSILVQRPPFVTEARPCRVSVVFDGSPNSRLADTLPNVVIRALDDVYFAVHSGQLLSTSTNRFNRLLTATSQYTPSGPAMLNLPEPSDVVNDMLHTIYGLPCNLHWPSLESIQETLNALRKYGMTPLEVHVFRDTFLHHAIVHQANDRPFEAYTLAAEYGLEDVAVATSAKTLHLRVYDVQNDLTSRMGVQYLRRLHVLHLTRAEALKQLFVVHFPGHAQRPSCTAAHQEETRIEFQFVCASLFMREPALHREHLEAKLVEFRERVACQDCKAAVSAEVDRILTGFNNLQTTI